ncbi:hypothetical protein PINS_up000977 [Pythium insidiosum]|nr:hypothetical protein PINS_up000977 [Pythium insidiosum]
MTLVLPIALQCPLCLDVLRRPIQLPCCQRHLCLACFERSLALTSANCGFCRKRLVGFARKKQYKVDDALWAQVQACCPLAASENDDDCASLSIEFVDELAPPRGRSESGDDHSEQQLHSAATATATTTTMMNTEELSQAQGVQSGALVGPPQPQPQPQPQQQRRLDLFFSARSEGVSTRRSSKKETPRTGATTTSTPRAHSPKRRRSQVVQRTLLQLTIHSPTAAVVTRSSSQSRRTSDRQVRRAWRCTHCTFENTCFDTKCSMCQQRPADAMTD